jgi:hypothetical protein
MKIEKVDFVSGLHITGVGSVTSVNIGKEGVSSLEYDGAQGFIIVKARGREMLVPITNVKSILAKNEAAPVAPQPQKK